jgi:hypothetical protein
MQSTTITVGGGLIEGSGGGAGGKEVPGKDKVGGRGNKGDGGKKEGWKGDSNENRKFYDIYADNQDTPLKELMRWVMTTYVPPRFIEIFVELLTRIEARVQKVNFETKRNLVMELLKFIAEYLYIFPSRRYDLIKHFYDTQIIQGVKVRASMLHDILKNSYFASKMQRIIEYMTTKEAGDGYLDKDRQVIFNSYGYYGAVHGKIFPVFVVMTKTKLFILKETLEKAFDLAALDSLSPYPPKCLTGLEYKDIKDVFQYPDFSSVRITSSWSTHVVDFVSRYQKQEFMEHLSQLLGQVEGHQFTLNELPADCKKLIDTLYSCAIFESEAFHDKRTYTQIVMEKGKRLLHIDSNSMNAYIIDLSEEGAK